ncbi:MAG: hypothetical protein A2W31_05795 [Planctomycetes bacterium RBG_16_64_10]|nr:MAG: hypothetical protein A2W31_05795 [Planctomycetes bacterium RBG_16_64_10]
MNWRRAIMQCGTDRVDCRRAVLGLAIGCLACAVALRLAEAREFAAGLLLTSGRLPLERLDAECFGTTLPDGSPYAPSQHSALTIDTKRNLLLLLDQHALAFFTLDGKYVRDVLLFNDGNLPPKTFGDDHWRYRYQDCEGLAYRASRDTLLVAMEDQYHVWEVDQNGNLVAGGLSIQAEVPFAHRWGANMEGIAPVDDDVSKIWFVQEDNDPIIACVDRSGRLLRWFRSDCDDVSDVFYVREFDVLLVLSHMSASVTLYTPEGQFLESFILRYGRGHPSGRYCLHKAEGLSWRDGKLYVAGEGEACGLVEVYRLPLEQYVARRPRHATAPMTSDRSANLVMHLSISDFAQNWGKSDRTWGPAGVRSLLDRVFDTGIRVVNWRTTCSGAMNYPTRIEGADTYRYEDFGKAGPVDFGSWDSFEIAVDHAHARGMQIWAWYDQTDSHGGCGGPRVHNSFLRRHPYTTRCTEPGGQPNPIEVAEHGDPACPLRGRGTQASLAFAEVQQLRLNLIREMAQREVDGVYIVEYGAIGFEEPVVQSFRQAKGLAENMAIDPTDPAWIAHQAEILIDYLLNTIGVPPQRLHRRYEMLLSDPKAVEDVVQSTLGSGAALHFDEATNVEWTARGWETVKDLVARGQSVGPPQP